MTEPVHEHGGHGQMGFGRHGMLIVGLDAIFVSHLPMFQAPHDVQLLAEVELEEAEEYRRDRRASGEPVYTINPEPFSWMELVPEGAAPPKRTSFTAEVFRGHFEREGTRIIEHATVQVRTVDYASKLSAGDPPAKVLTYRGVGRGDDLFLAHEIRGAPNFDQVLSFGFADPAFAGLELSGTPVVLEGRPDSVESRLQPGERVNASFPQTIGPTGQHGFSTALAVRSQAYLEIEELAG